MCVLVIIAQLWNDEDGDISKIIKIFVKELYI